MFKQVSGTRVDDKHDSHQDFTSHSTEFSKQTINDDGELADTNDDSRTTTTAVRRILLIILSSVVLVTIGIMCIVGTYHVITNILCNT